MASITIPDSITSIGYSAFSGFTSLASVSIPDSVTSIGSWAFSGCTSLTSITIPDSVTSIGDYAFRSCSSLISITIPDGVTSIGDNAFTYCSRLTKIVSNYKLTKKILGDPSNPVYISQISNLPNDWKPYAAVFFAEHPDEYDAASRTAYEKYIKANANKLVLLGEKHPALMSLIRELQSTQTKKTAKKASSQNVSFFDLLGGDAAFKSLKLPKLQLPTVNKKDGTPADESILKGLILAYAGQYARAKEFKCQRIDSADRVAMTLDEESFQLAIKKLFEAVDVSCPKLILFFVRYARGKLFNAVAKACRSEWYLQNSIDMGYLMNDSREAMIMADRKHELAKYASLRGLQEEEIIDKEFSDFGFDEQGVKRYDLGGCVVRVTLQPDLTLELVNETTGKPIKLLPKKNTDEIKRNTAADDLADMRRNIKRVMSIKGNRLLASFLSGDEMDAAQWKGAYMTNPFLRALARLLVWQQGNQTFTLRDTEALDSAGSAYTLTDAPIRVAHPMEMQPEDVAAWQKYFANNSLKQLFEQVWEPAYAPESIRPERYEGAVVPAKYLLHRQKQGIDLDIYEYDYGNCGGTEDSFVLKDCHVDYELLESDNYDDSVAERYAVKLGKFTFEKFNRQVNHIVYLMDRVTVRDRIAKDDISVMEQITSASLPQITEYLSIAMDHSAANVTAALLDFKNTHFADIDPMDEFTLDW